MTSNDLERIFPGNSELARLMRGLDWSKTDLGLPEQWPEHWKTAVRLCLTSRIPVVMYWGAAFTVLYNDPYISFLGETKHPRFLGRPGRECWSEIWDTIGPMLENVYATGEATWSEDLLMFFARRLPLEEVYVRFTFGPLMAADGTVNGIFCPCTETTEQVVGARRLETLRKLGIKPAEARTVETACAHAAEVLAENRYDIPFAGIYLLDGSGAKVSLCAVAGLHADVHPLPRSVSLEEAGGPWPFAAVLKTHQPQDIADLGTLTTDLVGGPWQEPTRQAVVLPILGAAPGSMVGLLVIGVSTRRILDPAYRTFFDLVAGHIGTAIVDARAYEAERQRAETLAELDRAKTAFFSNVSHEFRTPLTLLLGPLEDQLTDTTEPLSATRRQDLQMVHRNAMRLMRLVNILLDFSRIEAGRVQAVYAPVNLATVTVDLASTFRAAVERAGLKLIIECPALNELVYVDRDMWEKIVLNLLSNAFKFTFQGEIAVTVRRDGDLAVLHVRDTGIGIPPEEVPHLFERFHRVQGAHGRTHEGSGIGLALVQELVKLHAGTVRVDSEVNRGTTFTIAIPFGTAHLPTERIAATASAEQSGALTAAPYIEEVLRWLPDDIAPDVGAISHAPAGISDARILLADDNADMRDYVRRLLAQHWTVEAVADGEAALVAARARRPDLVLTDVMMPRLDGFGLLRALRADRAAQGIPVILLSARAGEESRVEGLEAGADDYLVKPFSARELIARVNAHLQLARMRNEMMSREQVARAEAEEANRSKDEFLATLSHELRTPLNSILGWSVMLKNRPTDVALLSNALNVIERNARAQSQLIEDLLDVSRIITGKLRLDVRTVDLVDVVNAALDAVRPAAAAKDIRLTAVLDPSAGPIAGDPDRLQQVLWNLLSNAVKFTPRRGRVLVRLQRVNSHVDIVVTDTGCGIAGDVLPLIFDRFHQVDGTTTRRHGGLGLGLSLVKHLVELHGGSVRAESAGHDRGATFTIELPVMAQLTLDGSVPAQASQRRHEPVVPPLMLDGLRLLVVDDDADTLELFNRLFTDHGASVTVAATAAEALAAVSKAVPDVVLCDIEMPGEDGYALIREVRRLSVKQGGTVPAIAVTAYGSVADRIRLLSAGFQMHVAKPADPDELVTVVASVAGRVSASAR